MILILFLRQITHILIHKNIDKIIMYSNSEILYLFNTILIVLSILDIFCIIFNKYVYYNMYDLL